MMARANVINCYPRPKYERLVVAYANDNDISYSEALEDMIQNFFRTQVEMTIKLEQRIIADPSLIERRKRK